MRTTRPMGTVSIPVADGSITATINVEYDPQDFQPGAPVEAGTALLAFTVVGNVGDYILDLGVHRGNIPARGFPAHPDVVLRTEPIPTLIAEFRQRLAELTRLATATTDHPAPSTDTGTVNDPVGAARQETDAWRRLAHALNVEVRRRLIPLVRANLMPLDLACRILEDAGLPALPRLWTVRLTPLVRRRTHATSADQATIALRHDLDQAVRQTFGPDTTITFDQPPQAAATGRRERTGQRPYTIHGQPMLAVTVRAETRRQAYASAGTLLTTALRSLPGVEVGDAVAIHVEPDPHGPVDLDVDTDAPWRPYTPLPVTAGTLTEARAARQVAMQAWQYQARRIRAALIDALTTADFGDQPGGHGPYGIVNDLLTDLGLPGLPHAHRYEITAAITLYIAADTPAAARIAVYRRLRDATAACPQYGLPISTSTTFHAPDISEPENGSFKVTWYETYLVSLRATHAPRLAEHAVRLQLSVLAETMPHITTAPLTTVYLGEHIDHRLDPDHD